MQVQDLVHEELKRDVNGTFYTIIHWNKPLFNYSRVKFYVLRYGPESAFGIRRKRSVESGDTFSTVSSLNN